MQFSPESQFLHVATLVIAYFPTLKVLEDLFKNSSLIIEGLFNNS